MNQKGTLTRVLAGLGTALVWLPILAPVVMSAMGLLTGRPFNVDYLMPAELFPAALAGGGLLLWAALRAQARRAIIIGGLGAAAAALIGGQVVAMATGLATGAIEPVGWPWALVLASLGLYALALVVVGGGGALLLRDLLRAARPLPGGG